MIAVFYEAATGRITHTMTAHRELIESGAQGECWIEVDEFRPDWDVTHMVVDGKLVDRPDAEVNAELAADAARSLRAMRDARLTHEVDPLVCNPLRWEALSPDQQNAVRAYRQALLDLTHTTPDPLNVTWPTKPDCIR